MVGDTGTNCRKPNGDFIVHRQDKGKASDNKVPVRLFYLPIHSKCLFLVVAPPVGAVSERLLPWLDRQE